jgi:hypothetical protein
MIDHGRDMTAAAFAEWMRCQVRGAQMVTPASRVVVPRLGAIVSGATIRFGLPAWRTMDRRAVRHQATARDQAASARSSSIAAIARCMLP